MSEAADVAGLYSDIVYGIGSAKSKDETGFQMAFASCESPIEQAFCLTMFQIPRVRCVRGKLNIAELAGDGRYITIFPQYPILRYRTDFLLVGTSPISAEPIFVIVECDGAAYHSEREQQRRDAARQDELIRTGFRVMRFSGRQLFRDPESVAAVVISAFKPLGWPQDAGRWVINTNLQAALRELREATGSY